MSGRQKIREQAQTIVDLQERISVLTPLAIASFGEGTMFYWRDHAEALAERLASLESKLPTYADIGERFVPGVDECWIVYRHYEVIHVGKVDSFGDVGIYWHDSKKEWQVNHYDWTGHFYSTDAAAQAEADRLNEENE